MAELGATSWRNLEARVARYFERNGYAARTNHKETGRSGLVHEIDVLAERRDAAGTHRIAVECKWWRSRIEKDIIYKLEAVLKDTGLSKGIVVAAGGLRSGARVAAEQAHIEVWGQDEIRHHLGEEALAGLPLALPDEALGVERTVSPEDAEREIKKARGGFAGIGAEDIAWIELLWVPAVELELAITWSRPGLRRDREEVIRRWCLYELLTGGMIGQRDEPRTFVDVELDAAALRQQKASAQIVGNMRQTVAKHRNARTEAAESRRQAALNPLGLPGSTRGFAVEAETQVYVPHFVGLLRRKGSERFVAIHAGVGSRSEEVEHALHEKIDVVRQARQAQDELHVGPAVSADPPTLSEIATPAPACRCGAAMVLRHRRVDGAAFWGCPTFPRCRHTQPVD